MTSLHTQYRPTSFDEVMGQDNIIASLKQAVQGKRAHTFLFSGPSGTGKTTLARILANQFAGGHATAANIEEIDAASKSGADDMRAVVVRSHHRAVGASPVKTIIVDEVHRLSAAAWTVLLKPIEEPPAHVYWALCTTEFGKIPKTIVTRCLRYELKPVSEELIYELLVKVADAEALETSEDVLEAIAEASLSSPRQALVYLESCSQCKTPAEARLVMRSAVQSKEAVDLARFLLSGRGQNWAEAMKYVKALEGLDAESIRIALCNYFSAVLIATSGDTKAKQVLALLEPFLVPYTGSDRTAPLLRSIGFALGLDQ